ncbi:MAG TPA: AzlD domain-containing protein [Acidimicrobiales bacterium]
MTVWLTIVLVAIGTYALRLSMIVLASRGEIPALFGRSARCGLPAVFAALAATALMRHAAFEPEVVAPFTAVAVAIVAVRRTKSPFVAVLAGMPALWLVSALVGS